MGILIRASLVFGIVMAAAHFVGDAGIYTRPIFTLVLLGAISIFLGPLASEGGFWARFHYVNQGTPGCVWYALGIICWGIAIALIISAKQGA